MMNGCALFLFCAIGSTYCTYQKYDIVDTAVLNRDSQPSHITSQDMILVIGSRSQRMYARLGTVARNVGTGTVGA